MNPRAVYRNATAIALALAAMTTGAAAQDTAADDTLYLGRIVLDTSRDGTPVYAGENVSRLEGTAVTAQGGTATIDDVVRQVPGAQTRLNPGQPGVAVSIRGLQGQGRVAMTVEGVPQNFRFNGHASEGYANFDPLFLQGIDITRGAVLTAGGSGSAGAVDFRLIDAEDVVDGYGAGGRVRLSYGDNGDNFGRMAAAGYVDERVSLLGAYARTTADAFEDGAGHTVDNTGRDLDSYLLRGGYQLTETQSLEFLATRMNADYASNSYFQEMTSDIYKLSYHLDHSPAINLSANLYRSVTDNEYTGSITGTGSYVGRQMETITTGIDVTNVSDFMLGGWSVTSTNGVEYIEDVLGGAEGGANPTYGDAKRLGVFTENVFSNGPWEIMAGLRYSDYRLHGRLDNELQSGDVDIDDSSIDPKISVAYQVNDWLQPYVAFSRSTRAPSLQETLQESFHGYGTVNLYLGPNPDLETETSEGGEIGVNIARQDLFTAGDSLTARVAYYKMNVDNYVAYVQEGGFTSVGPTILSYYDNIPGTTVTQGLEIEAAYDSELWAAALSYTNSDSTPPSGYDDYELQPPETFSATLARHFLNGDLTTGATYSYTASADSLDSQSESDDYGLWDVFASYQAMDNLFVSAKVANLTDEEYEPWASTGNGPGRTYYVGLELTF
ncbi:TonB-dependent receptor domain-containing protein [Salipiger bermudensis]|uniref:TonB-dependent receptor domain-containing protein n=1 Tax=Salipiger bermudensis TaxID=344736 RepID=UPI001CD30186|nr:TonB-dependent receptor [Salipiger bermudensis]MCA0962774.1 TonB-dependent receptor [Salipiger bermudensis]